MLLKRVDPRHLYVPLRKVDIDVVDESQLHRVEEYQKENEAFEDRTLNAPYAVLPHDVAHYQVIERLLAVLVHVLLDFWILFLGQLLRLVHVDVQLGVVVA